MLRPLIWAASLLPVLALSQGTVNFANSATSLIRYAGVAVPIGEFTVGLYYGVAGTTDPDSLTPLGATTQIAVLPGRFFGGTRTTPSSTAGGTSAVFEVRAWSGSFASYEAAAASGDPEVLIGRSGLFINTTGNPGGTPPTPPASLVFSGIGIERIPEPSGISLVVMAALAGLGCRRQRSG